MTLKKGRHLCGSVLDHLLGDEVVFVSNEQLVHTLDGVSVNLLQPLLDVGEGV